MSPTQSQTDFPTKRQNLIQLESDKPPPLLPGLPDHIAQLCLSRVNPSLLFNVSRSWGRLIYSPSFPPFLSLYTLLYSKSDKALHFYSFDPISSSWKALPPPPSDPPIHFLLHHPSFLSRKLPIQSVSVSGNLVLLAATTHNLYPALTRPLLFNPIQRKWVFGPPLLTPRRWCVAGSLRNVVYVASGIGSQFSTDVARSVEKWDLNKTKNDNNNFYHNGGGGWGTWEKMKGLKDGRFCRDAADAIGWRGKLYMVNVKGYGPKEGVVYDVDSDTWHEMPEGMIKGWRGPVAAVDDEAMFMVDETNGTLRKYDEENDDWVEIIQSNMLVGAQQIAGGGGRICVVGSGEGGIVVVDVVAAPPRLWVVDTPKGFQALTVHILPRMSQPVTTN